MVALGGESTLLPLFIYLCIRQLQALRSTARTAEGFGCHG